MHDHDYFANRQRVGPTGRPCACSQDEPGGAFAGRAESGSQAMGHPPPLGQMAQTQARQGLAAYVKSSIFPLRSRKHEPIILVQVGNGAGPSEEAEMTKRESMELAHAWDRVGLHAEAMRREPPFGAMSRGAWTVVIHTARVEAAKARDLAATLTEVEAQNDVR